MPRKRCPNWKRSFRKNFRKLKLEEGVAGNTFLKAMNPPEINIKYVAHLARLALTPEEEKTMGEQLAHVLGYIDKLKEVDVSGVEATAHAFPMVNVTRPDEVRPSLSNEEALRNAPAHANGLFIVPKIVE